MSLRPDPTIHRLLISATCHLVGEYDDGDVAIYHAWPGMTATSIVGASKRTALVVSFVAPEPQRRPGIVIPNYNHVGDHVGAYLAVLFGKRFDNMGILESHGRFAVPEMGVYSVPHRLDIPHNSDHVRADIPVPLNVAEAKRLHGLFHETFDDVATLTKFNAACAFYYLAIGNFEADPEVSYLHLITAGEILAGAVDVADQELLDEQLKAALERVTTALNDGGATARFLRSRLYQVKRRFKLVLGGLLDDAFFERSESRVEYGRLKKDTIDQRLGAAYDLRSKYVHTGESFGNWVSRAIENSEFQSGTPILPDPDFVKILALAPNFIGLERIIRYCLLRFGERHFGVDLAIAAPKPSADAPTPGGSS
jgi:hypothetical protein